MSLNVGEDDAEGTISTPFSTVTEDRIGPVTPEEMGPTMAGTPSRSTRRRAASTPTEGCVWSSRTMYSSLLQSPTFQPAAFMCSTASAAARWAG